MVYNMIKLVENRLFHGKPCFFLDMLMECRYLKYQETHGFYHFIITFMRISNIFNAKHTDFNNHVVFDMFGVLWKHIW